MKLPTFALCFFLCVFGLCLPVLAGSYVDDMADMDQNSIKTYSMLAPVVLQGSAFLWEPMPDQSLFTFASSANPIGWAQYRIEGAQQVTVGIYNNPGTFVSELPFEPGSYTLGAFQTDMSHLTGRRIEQALYSAGKRDVYAMINGRLKTAAYDKVYYTFQDTGDNPGSLIGYGVNVYVSADGNGFSRLQLAQSRMYTHPGLNFCYEEWTGAVPGGVHYVRVEINDVLQVPQLGSQAVIQKAPRLLTSLASVAFTGNNLVLGIPEPLTTESAVLPNKSSADESQSSTGGKLAANDGGVGGGSSSAPASKFEGVITSSEPSQKSSRSSSAAKKEKSEKEESSESFTSSSSGESSTEEVVVYEIPRTTSASDKSFTAGVTAYILVVAGVILVVIILPKK